jgi:hypothetical protein
VLRHADLRSAAQHEVEVFLEKQQLNPEQAGAANRVEGCLIGAEAACRHLCARSARRASLAFEKFAHCVPGGKR